MRGIKAVERMKKGRGSMKGEVDPGKVGNTERRTPKKKDGRKKERVR